MKYRNVLREMKASIENSDPETSKALINELEIEYDRHAGATFMCKANESMMKGVICDTTWKIKTEEKKKLTGYLTTGKAGSGMSYHRLMINDVNSRKRMMKTTVTLDPGYMKITKKNRIKHPKHPEIPIVVNDKYKKVRFTSKGYELSYVSKSHEKAQEIYRSLKDFLIERDYIIESKKCQVTVKPINRAE